MRLRGTAILTLLVLAAVVAATRIGAFEARTHCDVIAPSVPADGRWHAVARLWQRYGSGIAAGDFTFNTPDAHLQSLDTAGSAAVLYRAPLLGGNTTVTVRYRDQAWSIPLRTLPQWKDSVGDGLPDALRLHDAEDRLRFRGWFTALADQAAALPGQQLPAEITDCSALLRYSYRLALMKHDDRWYKQFTPGTMPILPSVQQWTYPETPLGAGLFRVTPVTAAPPQASDFAEFADAKTLLGRNSFRIGRDVHAARPGDLLFFHQLEGEQQYHSMIVTGDGAEWVVYHTGPDGSGAVSRRGEMRRARIEDLLQHPDPRWHPTSVNPNFLGVYRWNLLRED